MQNKNHNPNLFYVCKKCEGLFSKKAHRKELVTMRLCPQCYTQEHMDRVRFSYDNALSKEEEHAERHKILHKRLDELVADWMNHTTSFLSQNTVFDLMQWSNKQSKELDHKRH